MKKELSVEIEFDNRMQTAKVVIYEQKTQKSSCHHKVEIGSEAFGGLLMDNWISEWVKIQEEKRAAIAEKKSNRAKTRDGRVKSKHDSLVEICRKANAEGLSYAKYVQKYGV